MPDYVKRTMLENLVNGIPNLRAVKAHAAQFRAQMVTKLTYEQYFTLLKICYIRL